MSNWEPAADFGPSVTHGWSTPAKMRKKYCWVNIAVYPRLQLISHTQPATITITPRAPPKLKFVYYVWLCLCIYLFMHMYAAIQQQYFENKVWEIYFYKEVCSFVHWSSYIIIFTNLSARAGYDTRSIFKRSLTGFNSEFSFSPSPPYYLPILAGGRIFGFIPFPRVLVLWEMQSISSRIWTRVTVSISCDDNHYTTGTT